MLYIPYFDNDIGIRNLEFGASVHFLLFFLNKINYLIVCWSSDVKNEEAEAGFDDHSRELLENISIEQKFEVTYVDIEELSKKVIFLKKYRYI